jgi:hypothetical protein
LVKGLGGKLWKYKNRLQIKRFLQNCPDARLRKYAEQNMKKRTKSVQNPCSPFYGRSAEPAPDLAPAISPVSTVVVRVIGNDEVSGSIPLPGTTPQKTTERGALSEMEVMVRLARLGASVWTPAFGHDHSFDLIAHWSGCMSRVQVKTMRDVDDNSISLSGTRVIDRAGGKQYPAITAADCDVIIGYHPGFANPCKIRAA